MPRVNGRSRGINPSQVRQNRLQQTGRKDARRIQQVRYTRYLPALKSCCSQRPLSSYKTIQDVLRDLPSAKMRQHVPLSERKALLEAQRNNSA